MRAVVEKLPLKGSDLVLTLVMVAGFTVLGVSSGGNFFSPQGILSFFAYLSVPILIGLAQMAVVAAGQLNLAVGAMGGAICSMMAVMMSYLDAPVWLALTAGLVAGVLLGALNGLLIVATGLHGFIVTLGTMTILLGVQFALVRSFTVDGYPEALKTFGRQNVIGIPFLFLITVGICVVLHIFYSRTVAGRRLLATGGSPVAARLSGISNAKSMVLAFSVSGLLIGLASLASIASLTGINRSIGGDWLLNSFAAPIIAGVLLTGGSVAIYGTVIAACLLRIVDVARAEFLLDPSWTNFVIGTVVLSTVALTEYRKRRGARMTTRGVSAA